MHVALLQFNCMKDVNSACMVHKLLENKIGGVAHGNQAMIHFVEQFKVLSEGHPTFV